MVPRKRLAFALLLGASVVGVGVTYAMSLHDVEQCREFDRAHRTIAAECEYQATILEHGLFLLELALFVPLGAGYLWSRDRGITAHRRLARSPLWTLLWWAVAAVPLLVGLVVFEWLFGTYSSVQYIPAADSLVHAGRIALRSYLGTHLDIPFAMAVEFPLLVLLVLLYVHALSRFGIRERVQWPG